EDGAPDRRRPCERGEDRAAHGRALAAVLRGGAEHLEGAGRAPAPGLRDARLAPQPPPPRHRRLSTRERSAAMRTPAKPAPESRALASERLTRRVAGEMRSTRPGFPSGLVAFRAREFPCSRRSLRTRSIGTVRAMLRSMKWKLLSAVLLSVAFSGLGCAVDTDEDGISSTSGDDVGEDPTREGEEALILDAWRPQDKALLVLVPRHPQRFDDVAREIEARGLAYRRRSSLGYEVPPDVQVVLGDSMGEMFAYYVAADLAFIGGSLLPLGGQNLIEACAVGTPVLIGEHTFNFAAVSTDAVAAGAAIRVHDATAMLQQAAALLTDDDTRRAMGMRAREYALQHRGATARTVWLLAPLLG
ncbi:MAG: glycosyltransferase, partial [Oxalobacteraceae bacterium]